MRYLIALLCPPLAVLLCGRPFQSVLNFFLTLCGYFPGGLHALLVVSSHLADRRSERQIAAIKDQTRETKRQTRDFVKAIAIQTVILKESTRAAPAPGRTLPGSQAAPATGPAITSPPRKPRITLGEIRAAAVATKDEAIRAYRNLPEWAQPVCWGLAAGSPVSVALVVFLLIRG